VNCTAILQEEEDEAQRFLPRLHQSVMIGGKLGQVSMPLHFASIDIIAMLCDEVAFRADPLVFVLSPLEVHDLVQLNAE